MKSLVYEDAAPLGATDEYVSGTRDMTLVAQDFGIAVSHFVVEVDSDQAGTIEIDESTDRIVWSQSQAPTVYTADSGTLRLSVLPTLQFVRAAFVNGSTPQTRFEMSTGVDYF